MSRPVTQRGAPTHHTETPAMRQYRRIKAQYPDAILFFRMGDFYEMFFEDAVEASRVLEIALTSRNKQSDNPVPLCGIPYHAADAYIARLIKRGYRVAICEQVEDPRTAKGVVKREVVRVVTPGTLLDTGLLEAKRHHYLGAVSPGEESLGIAFLDLATGDFWITETERERVRLEGVLSRFEPKEILLPDSHVEIDPFRSWLDDFPATLTMRPAVEFEESKGQSHVRESYGDETLKDMAGLGPAWGAAAAVLRFVRETQRCEPTHVRKPRHYRPEGHLLLDAATIRNLELLRNLHDGSQTGSLLDLLDDTVSPMGGRCLRDWVLQPLVDVLSIEKRQESIACLMETPVLRMELRQAMKGVADMERIAGRVHLGVAHPREVAALRTSLEAVPRIRAHLARVENATLQRLHGRLDPLEDLTLHLSKALVDDPPHTVREGGIFRHGYNTELDELRSVASGGKDLLTGLEQRERERTGIPSLKVGYNRVFGYYIEITKAHQKAVPPDYVRKQTLVGAERYITAELKAYEERVLGAQERIRILEYHLFQELAAQVAAQIQRLQQTARAVGTLDALAGLAEVGHRNRYVIPKVGTGDVIEIREGRHPVVEGLAAEGGFVPNDTHLDCGENRLHIVTGPNMAGKSTFLRQVALIVLMAQMGAPVPAVSASIGLVDRIFTRVGATDYLIRGQSTFMVEMDETATILQEATPQSLVVLDEIGRGTSTFDGISIAWAVSEYLARLQARTLFATHYHELTELALTLEGVKNYQVSVREWNDRIVFLHRIVEGGADKSYGIQVARLAGLPEGVIQRANEILGNLEQAALNEVGEPRLAHSAGTEHRPQLDLFATQPDPVVQEIVGIDLTSMTPLEAMNALARLQQQAAERGGEGESREDDS